MLHHWHLIYLILSFCFESTSSLLVSFELVSLSVELSGDIRDCGTSKSPSLFWSFVPTLLFAMSSILPVTETNSQILLSMKLYLTIISPRCFSDELKSISSVSHEIETDLLSSDRAWFLIVNVSNSLRLSKRQWSSSLVSKSDFILSAVGNSSCSEFSLVLTVVHPIKKKKQIKQSCFL